MGFPGTWMTESESMVYRVVPKCACSTIGQIMYYADHGSFYGGDIHDAIQGLHKWAREESQNPIRANVKARGAYAFTAVRNPYSRILSSFFDKICDRVVVMRQGRMVESAPVDTLFAAPQHDYTRRLLAAVPRLGAGAERAKPLPPVSTAPAARLVDARVHFDIGSDFFGRPTHRVHAVEKVSFDIRPGETFGLVGESGCGKSTIAKALSGLVPHAGHIEVDGKALAGLTDRGRRDICRDIQMVFQDPMAALDPRMTVGEAVMEPLLVHGIGSAEDRIARATELFDRVGLSAGQMQRYPHEFSGGQRQRICVARALALKPKLIICDESVSALDVSVQAQVLALLEELQQETGVSYLFISHDMAVVENVVDRLAVMYLGQIVEMGTRDQVFGNPQHSYTRRLLDAVPIPDPSRKGRPHARRATDLPSPIWKINEGPTPVSLRDIGAGHLVAEDG